MSALRRLLRRLIHAIQPNRGEAELDREIAAHLVLLEDECRRCGQSPEEARRSARLMLGGIAQTKELHREARSFMAIDEMRRASIQDVRYAIRTLRTAPGFTWAALVTLALGTGANTVIFSVINTALLSPPNFKHLDRVVEVFDLKRKNSNPDRDVNPSPGNFLDWRRQTRSFDHLVGWRNWYYSFSGPEGGADLPESVRGVRISPGFFSMLGVDLALGRTFEAIEETPGRDQVVILASSLWKRHFGGDRDILGRKVSIDGRAFTVVGVLPDDFCFLQPDFELWMPLSVDDRFNGRDDHSVMVFGRLAAGVSIEQAQSELDSIATGLERIYPDTNAGWGTRMVRIYPSPYANARHLRSALLILFAAVGFVLLIACANVANLLLARAELRRREIAIRAAIGASRAQIVRQMLTESLVLAVIGAALALALAYWGLQGLTPLLPRIPAYRALVPVLDGRVLLFTLGIALLTGIGFGLPPAFQATNPEALRLTTSSRRGMRSGRVLMISELALSIVLLIGAALLVKSLWRLQNIHPGFKQDHLLTAQISLPKAKYPDGSGIANFYRETLRRLEGLPEVRSAAAVSFRPFQGMSDGTRLDVHGWTAKPGEQSPVVEYRIVTPGYLRTLGVPFTQGRDLSDADGAEAAGAVVVNQTTAQRLWPNENPIGKQIRPRFGGAPIPWRPDPDPRQRWLTVVGVAGNIKEAGLNDREHAEIYLSYLQFPSSFMFLVIRTQGPPERLSAAVRGAVLAVDHDQPVSDIRSMDSAIRESAAGPRLNAGLLALFVILAVLLSAAGVYGVMSYLANQRSKEMAIRMALGASPKDIKVMVLREMAVLAIFATLAGLAAAAWVTRTMKSLLFEVAPLDAAVFAVASVMLLAVALAACYLPARKAARVDLIATLRM